MAFSVVSLIIYYCWFSGDESTQKGVEPSTLGTQISTCSIRFDDESTQDGAEPSTPRIQTSTSIRVREIEYVPDHSANDQRSTQEVFEPSTPVTPTIRIRIESLRNSSVSDFDISEQRTSQTGIETSISGPHTSRINVNHQRSTQTGFELSTPGTPTIISRADAVPNSSVSNHESNEARTLPPPSYNEVIENDSDSPPTYYEAIC